MATRYAIAESEVQFQHSSTTARDAIRSRSALALRAPLDRCPRPLGFLLTTQVRARLRWRMVCRQLRKHHKTSVRLAWRERLRAQCISEQPRRSSLCMASMHKRALDHTPIYGDRPTDLILLSTCTGTDSVLPNQNSPKRSSFVFFPAGSPFICC